MVSGESKCKGTKVERSLESLSHPAEAKVEETGTKMVGKEQCRGRGTLHDQDVEDGSDFSNPERGLRTVTRLLCHMQRLLTAVLSGFLVCKVQDAEQDIHLCSSVCH